MAKLLLGPLLCRVPGSKRVGHFIERPSETADFGRTILEVRAGIIIPVAPFGGDAEQTLYRATDEISTAGPGRVDCREKTDEDEPDTAPGGAVDRSERLCF
jgi:hypothetical protein